MRLKLVQVGELVLREASRPLTPEEIRSSQIQDLIASMLETLRDAPGVGLAAPQVGMPLQLAIIEDRSEYMKDLPAELLEARERKPVPFHVIVNPKLQQIGDAKVEFFEGCLSLAGYMAIVPRARQARVDCLDERGNPRTIEATGWYARILQHEIDHLNGRLYIDRMRSTTFMSLDNFNRHWKDKGIDATKASLCSKCDDTR